MWDDKQDVLEEFEDAFIQACNYFAENYDSMKEDFEFYANKQWKETDIAKLKEELRPALTFNQIQPIINVVSGTEITNRYEPRYLARTLEDNDFNDKINGTAKYIREHADAEHEESLAFRDACICGIGAMEQWYDESDGPYGRIKFDRVPPFLVAFDTGVIKSNASDKRWVMRGKWVKESDFIARYGEEAFQNAKGSQSQDPMPHSAPRVEDRSPSEIYNKKSREFDSKRSQIVVYDFEVRHQEDFYIVAMVGEDGTPSRVEMSRTEFRKRSEELEGAVYQKKLKSVYYRARISGKEVLEFGESAIQNFTINIITGFVEQKSDGSVRFYGMVRGIKDPQNWANKMLSQIVHTVATNPKGALVAPKGLFEDPHKAKREWSRPNSFLEANITGGNIRDKIAVFQGQYPHQIERILDICIEAIPRITGVNPYVTGQVDDLRRTAQSAVSLLQKQGLVVLSVLYDSLRKYRKEAGRLTLNFIREYVDESTVIRINESPFDVTGKPERFNSQWIEQVEYDVVVDEAPQSSTASLEFWQTLVQTNSIEFLVQVGILTPDIVVDIMPNVPSSIRERMKKNYEMATQMANQQTVPQSGEPGIPEQI